MSTERKESLPRRQTDPAWLQDHFLGTGHDEETRNATFTFVKRHNRHFAVTCRHIRKSVAERRWFRRRANPTLALHIDRAVLNLSDFSAKGIEVGVNAAVEQDAEREMDIAIASLEGSYWGLLTSKKNKIAIDLDNWREPDWKSVRYCLAAGYPDEHKQQVATDDGDKVGAGLLAAVAEVASTLGRSERVITLSSQLEKPHGYYLSGMSGGAVYAVEGHGNRPVEDEELFPIGIIFEGYPSSRRPDIQGSRDAASAFLTDRDLFFRALMLTPETFDEWLERSWPKEKGLSNGGISPT